jgi:hypothetical protein
MDEADDLGDGSGYTEPNWGKDRPDRPDRPYRPKSERWHDNHALQGDAVHLSRKWMFDSVYT